MKHTGHVLNYIQPICASDTARKSLVCPAATFIAFCSDLLEQIDDLYSRQLLLEVYDPLLYIKVIYGQILHTVQCSDGYPRRLKSKLR